MVMVMVIGDGDVRCDAAGFYYMNFFPPNRGVDFYFVF